MLEAIGVPILLKAVDFLFGEGSKILEERRKRRQSDQQSAQDDPVESTSADTEETLTSKDAVLTQRISETVWMAAEPHIQHLFSLLEIHTKNYYLARDQYAKWGSALVPPIVVHNLTEAEDAVARTTQELQVALSRIYGRRVSAPEV